MIQDKLKKFGLVIIFIPILIFTIFTDFHFFNLMIGNFRKFLLTMLRFIPAVFILIGLFEVWVKRETVEKHLGENSNFLAYIWVILLAGTTVGGLYVAFPVAGALFKKGAKLRVILTYLGASGVCRIPMTLFEATFVGFKFTLIRLITTLPLIIISSFLLEKFIITTPGKELFVKKDA